MEEHTYSIPCGTIHYWTNGPIDPAKRTLVFLPGLTADHRLFDPQIPAFQEAYNVLVWDAPGHNESRPFQLTFSLADKATWLKGILDAEGIAAPVLVGQSMGGYVIQVFEQLFPGFAAGAVIIDSAPLQRKFMAGWEIWSLKHVEPIYRCYPWKNLVRAGSEGVATTPAGQALMRQMMEVYNDDPKYYCHLTGHGYRILAEAIEADLPYTLTCPTILLCGTKDIAGSAKRYNVKWHEATGLPLHWIENAGHNANDDYPEEVNAIIADFLQTL